jgi:histidyl-tRNA synthetase
MRIKALRGTKDILPAEVESWQALEEKAKGLCRVYGYQEIRTPLLEEAALFVRSVGSSSDIVRKQMYSFLDRKGRRLCLRPEGTASVVRAYLEHHLDKDSKLAKFYYFGPMFRAERPQAGRLRQFHHIGVEAIGSLSPYIDAEVISLAAAILQQAGINDFTVHLNSIGCAKDRKRFKQVLKRDLKRNLRLLCSECKARYSLNLLRIFDCKDSSCRKIIQESPAISDYLCRPCLSHFQQVKQILDSSYINYTQNPYLMRGLDYYNKTCFEIIHPALGAQNAVVGGGRYDDLTSELGGPQIPALGFALGIERLIALLKPKEIISARTLSTYVYVAAIGDNTRIEAFKVLQALRKQGISCEMDYLDRSLKGQMRQADRLSAKHVAILGEDELDKGTLILRDMDNKSQKEVKIERLVEEVK